MRDVLQTEGAMKSVISDLKSATLVSFFLVLPFAVLEALNQTINKQNAAGLAVLFGLLWLLPVAFVVVLVRTARAARAGDGATSKPGKLLFGVAFLALIALMWRGIVIDQLPCFMGVPNCD